MSNLPSPIRRVSREYWQQGRTNRAFAAKNQQEKKHAIHDHRQGNEGNGSWGHAQVRDVRGNGCVPRGTSEGWRSSRRDWLTADFKRLANEVSRFKAQCHRRPFYRIEGTHRRL